jgi:hypothetical protein
MFVLQSRKYLVTAKKKSGYSNPEGLTEKEKNTNPGLWAGASFFG